MLWHWVGLYLAILLHLGHSLFLLLSYLSQPENSFHSSSRSDCITTTYLTSLATIIDYLQSHLHSSTSTAALMSSGAPLPQFYCGLSFVQQLLLRFYHGLLLFSLLRSLCFLLDLRATLDGLLPPCCQSHYHHHQLHYWWFLSQMQQQIWSTMILKIDLRTPVASFG